MVWTVSLYLYKGSLAIHIPRSGVYAGEFLLVRCSGYVATTARERLASRTDGRDAGRLALLCEATVLLALVQLSKIILEL